MLAKAFSWSFSKLKAYEVCPRRYEATDLRKTVEEQRSQALDRGDALHAAMYARIVGAAPLPPEFIYMETWATKLTGLLHPFQVIQGELKLSLSKDGKPTGFFERATWVRGLVDYFRLVPTEVKNADFGHVVDFKTGKPPKIWDGTQLLINAHLIFAHYKSVQKLRVDYLWTEYNDTTHEMFTRAEAQKGFAGLLPRVNTMEQAHTDNKFPPKPGGLCYEYCPVVSCEYHGKRPHR
jgi:hypothetical protein